MVENSSDVAYRMSLPDGMYEYVSPASTSIFGYPPEEWYDNPFLIREIMHPDCHSYFEEQCEHLLQGRFPSVYEYKIIHKNGGVRWINQRNTLVRDDNGHCIAIEGFVTDITKLKEVDSEKDALISELRLALAKIKKLEGLLPICSFCKNIRDNKGDWKQIETYIHERSDVSFSHSICPLCAKEHYPDIDIYDD